MVWEGLNAVKTGRVMLGATNPADSAPGTIRGDLCIQVIIDIIKSILLMTQIIYANLINSKEFCDIELALSDFLYSFYGSDVKSQSPCSYDCILRLDVTSATALTPSSPPTRRSPSGSSPRNSAATKPLRRTGSTSRCSKTESSFTLDKQQQLQITGVL